MHASPPLLTQAALFLDFDGTLVEFAETPSTVHMPGDLVELLTDLYAHLDGALAIVSGRPLQVLDRYLQPLRLPLAGEHGMQRRDGQGHCFHACVPGYSAARKTCTAFAAAHPAVHLEPKQRSLALHYRQAPHLRAACHAMLQGIAAAHPQLRVLEGRSVVELVAADIDKGCAIADFLRQAPFAGRVPVFAGDDRTDESGFAVVNRRQGISIKLGQGHTQARYRLAHPQALRQWLYTLRHRLVLQQPCRL